MGGSGREDSRKDFQRGGEWADYAVTIGIWALKVATKRTLKVKNWTDPRQTNTETAKNNKKTQNET